jgi:hypothetical protein
MRTVDGTFSFPRGDIVSAEDDLDIVLHRQTGGDDGRGKGDGFDAAGAEAGSIERAGSEIQSCRVCFVRPVAKNGGRFPNRFMTP